MQLKKVDQTILSSKAHAALDKMLKELKVYTETMTVKLTLKDIFAGVKPPTVHFTANAVDKINALVALSKLEIGWHGIVERDEATNTYTITDILVYPQCVSGVTTTATDDVGMWYMNIPEEQFNKLRMQGHSHVNMAVSPSPTDVRYYETLIVGVQDYYIFMIANKRDDVYVELHDIVNGVIYDSKDIKVTYETDAVTDWAEEQMVTHVIIPPPIVKKESQYPIVNHKYESAYDRLHTESYAEYESYYGGARR